MDMKPCKTEHFAPPRKRKRLDFGPLAIDEKQEVINIYKNSIDAGKNTTAAVKEINNTMGLSESTIYRILKEYKAKGLVTAPRKSGGRPNTVAIYNDYVKNAIRRIVHDFFMRNEVPTLDQILEQCHEDLPSLSRYSLYELIKLTNFKYLKRKNKSILVERDHIIRWRQKYLRAMDEFRKTDRTIYYLDETWINEDHTEEKISTGLKNPSGERSRLLALHCGSENGFVDGALLLFESRKTTDNHEEVNSTVFEKWFQKLLTKLPENAVIVMDSASHHSCKLYKIPTSSSKKKDMQDWLESKRIHFDSDMVRSELIQLVNLHKEKYDLYVIDEMAKKRNQVVLRFPPYHCELNPIELIWAKIKNEIASKNTTFELKDVKKLFLQAVKNVTSEEWKNYIKNVIQEEEKMRKVDRIMDDVIESSIVSNDNFVESSYSGEDDRL